MTTKGGLAWRELHSFSMTQVCNGHYSSNKVNFIPVNEKLDNIDFIDYIF
jgi:hypothetical protein